MTSNSNENTPKNNNITLKKKHNSGIKTQKNTFVGGSKSTRLLTRQSKARMNTAAKKVVAENEKAAAQAAMPRRRSAEEATKEMEKAIDNFYEKKYKLDDKINNLEKHTNLKEEIFDLNKLFNDVKLNYVILQNYKKNNPKDKENIRKMKDAKEKIIKDSKKFGIEDLKNEVNIQKEKEIKIIKKDLKDNRHIDLGIKLISYKSLPVSGYTWKKLTEQEFKDLKNYEILEKITEKHTKDQQNPAEKLSNIISEQSKIEDAQIRETLSSDSAPTTGGTAAPGEEETPPKLALTSVEDDVDTILATAKAGGTPFNDLLTEEQEKVRAVGGGAVARAAAAVPATGAEEDKARVRAVAVAAVAATAAVARAAAEARMKDKVNEFKNTIHRDPSTILLTSKELSNLNIEQLYDNMYIQIDVDYYLPCDNNKVADNYDNKLFFVGAIDKIGLCSQNNIKKDMLITSIQINQGSDIEEDLDHVIYKLDKTLKDQRQTGGTGKDNTNFEKYMFKEKQKQEQEYSEIADPTNKEKFSITFKYISYENFKDYYEINEKFKKAKQDNAKEIEHYEKYYKKREKDKKFVEISYKIPEEEVKKLEINTNKNGPIGIHPKEIDGFVFIKDVTLKTDAGPTAAAEAKLKHDMIIYKIDDQQIKSNKQLAEKIKVSGTHTLECFEIDKINKEKHTVLYEAKQKYEKEKEEAEIYLNDMIKIKLEEKFDEFANKYYNDSTHGLDQEKVSKLPTPLNFIEEFNILKREFQETLLSIDFFEPIFKKIDFGKGESMRFKDTSDKIDKILNNEDEIKEIINTKEDEIKSESESKTVTKLTENQTMGISFAEKNGHVFIKYIVPGGLASKKGLKPGMKITNINETPINSLEDAYKQVLSKKEVKIDGITKEQIEELPASSEIKQSQKQAEEMTQAQHDKEGFSSLKKIRKEDKSKAADSIEENKRKLKDKQDEYRQTVFETMDELRLEDENKGPYGIMMDFYENFRILDPNIKMTLEEFIKRLSQAEISSSYTKSEQDKVAMARFSEKQSELQEAQANLITAKDKAYVLKGRSRDKREERGKIRAIRENTSLKNKSYEEEKAIEGDEEEKAIEGGLLMALSENSEVLNKLRRTLSTESTKSSEGRHEDGLEIMDGGSVLEDQELKKRGALLKDYYGNGKKSKTPELSNFEQKYRYTSPLKQREILAKRNIKNEADNVKRARDLESGYRTNSQFKLDTAVEQDRKFSSRQRGVFLPEGMRPGLAAAKSRNIFSKTTFYEQCISLLKEIVVKFLEAIQNATTANQEENDLFQQKYITFILEFLFLEKTQPVKGNYRVFYVLQHASTFKLFSKIMQQIITELINDNKSITGGDSMDAIINENYFNIIKEKLLRFLNDYYYGLAVSYNTFSLKKRFGPVSNNVNKLRTILESNSKDIKNADNTKGKQVKRLIYQMFSDYGIDSKQSFEDNSATGQLLKLFNNTPKVKEFHDQIMNAKNVHEVNYVLSNYLKNGIDFDATRGELTYKLYGKDDDFQVKDNVDADYIQTLTDELATFAKKIPKISSNPLPQIEELRNAIDKLKEPAPPAAPSLPP